MKAIVVEAIRESNEYATLTDSGMSTDTRLDIVVAESLVSLIKLNLQREYEIAALEQRQATGSTTSANK